MNDRNRHGVAGIVGIVLIGVGAWLLLERVLGPLMWPLRAAMHALAFVGWPLALVALGLVLLARSRSREAAATPPAPAVGTYGASAPPAAAGPSAPASRMYRSRSNRVFGGVIAGAAAHLGVSVDAARFVFAIATLLTGVWPGIVLYAIALVVVPEEPASATSPAPPVPGMPSPAVPPTA